VLGAPERASGDRATLDRRVWRGCERAGGLTILLVEQNVVDQ
jgi:hypothetical protein